MRRPNFFLFQLTIDFPCEHEELYRDHQVRPPPVPLPQQEATKAGSPPRREAEGGRGGGRQEEGQGEAAAQQAPAGGEMVQEGVHVGVVLMLLHLWLFDIEKNISSTLCREVLPNRPDMRETSQKHKNLEPHLPK